MKKKLLVGVFIVLVFTVYKISLSESSIQPVQPLAETNLKVPLTIKENKKTPEEKAEFSQARLEHEFNLQANPATGKIPKEEKVLELKKAKAAKPRNGNSDMKAPDAAFVNRGASNYGGRTRAIVIDKSDATGNTIIAGGVSSGVFRTTNGGASWTKVSSNDEIHNVTAIAQDPTNMNIWYYGTGERRGNSASANGAFYFGQGIWKSTDKGINWVQIASTDSNFSSFDPEFDIIHALDVHPITGDLYAATYSSLLRFNGSIWLNLITSSSSGMIDVSITSTGRVYAGFSGVTDIDKKGVWTSATGTGDYTRINAMDFTPSGRVVLAIAPSNEDLVYVLFVNGNTSDCATDIQEADLWRWNQDTTTFTDYSAVLPSEGCGGRDPGNNPLSVQGGYDLVVSVKPDDANFVVVGGTNAYKKADVTDVNSRFTRIGGYISNSSYGIYDTAGGDEHHPDIHALIFDPNNDDILYSGTDGGVHKTDITTATTDWTSLNNNYQTQQHYHVAIDPLTGSDLVLGGLQDNGTNIGGTVAGFPDLTTQSRIVGGDGVAVEISRDDACIPLYAGFQNGDLYRNCGGYVFIRPSGSSSQFVTYFHLDPDNNNIIYYAGRNRLYRSNDATNVTPDTWDNMSTTAILPGGSSSEWFTKFSTSRGTYDAAKSYLLMGGDEGHIFRLDDPQNASSIGGAINITPPSAVVDQGTVTGLAIHPTNSDIVLATYSNYGIENIFLTNDATSDVPTWTLVERNLSAHSIRSAAITETAGQTLYFVGTARGLYSSSDPTSTDWEREAPAEIGLALVSDLKYRPSDNKLLIGTHGNGMYEATISDVLSTNSVSNISKDISLYPNPVQSNLNVKLANYLGESIPYRITNMLGQSVDRGSLNQTPINVSNLKAGMYFIELSIEGKKGVKRFIKQ